MIEFAKKYSASLFRYVLIGGLCALIDWSIFYVLVHHCNINYLIAGAVAFIIATRVNLSFSRKIFISKRSKKYEGVYIYAVSAIALGVDLYIMFLSVSLMAVEPILGKIIGTGCAFGVNYGARQFFIFSKEVKN